MTHTTATLASCNQDWGFWGSMQTHATVAWPMAMNAIAAATNCEPEQVRAFLDSRHGRHYADDVNNALYLGADLPNAIEQATQKWMTWTIGRNTAKEYGIPRCMAYLTGFVVYCGMQEEELVDA
jgi:hypothetical protein